MKGAIIDNVTRYGMGTFRAQNAASLSGLSRARGHISISPAHSGGYVYLKSRDKPIERLLSVFVTLEHARVKQHLLEHRPDFLADYFGGVL